MEDAWLSRLEALGLAVRNHLLGAHSAGEDWMQPVGQEGGDTIFAVDRQVEPVLVAAIDAWPAECKPLLLIAEGFGPDGRRRFGPKAVSLRYRLLVDPIDGTRGLMYDKRSAWFIAAVAEDRGEETSLADCFAAVLAELPVRKQGWADTFLGLKGRPTVGHRSRLDTGTVQPLSPRPSQASSLLHGFGQVANFFPGTKVLAAQLMERIAAATLGSVQPGGADVFDDQYISSGGQMVELMVGHDRFCCDLRPLFYRIQFQQGGQVVRGLECHPYDVAGALVASQAGVVLTDGFGGSLAPPLTVDHPVHWCGYANRDLQARIQPVIQEWLAEQGVFPEIEITCDA